MEDGEEGERRREDVESGPQKKDWNSECNYIPGPDSELGITNTPLFFCGPNNS